ncbi:hypothetical protein SB719_19860, partial [Pantoea sp. SIMBA_079]|uniref:hypothetical protein n=1 Tax=Pantoea sp. SIMBA_079 TaxID=3085817 RepID=UPI003996B37A
MSTEDGTSPTLQVKLGEKLGDAGEVLADDPAVPGELQRSTVIGAPSGATISFGLSYAGFQYAEVSGTTAPVSIIVDRVSAAP